MYNHEQSISRRHTSTTRIHRRANNPHQQNKVFSPCGGCTCYCTRQRLASSRRRSACASKPSSLQKLFQAELEQPTGERQTFNSSLFASAPRRTVPPHCPVRQPATTCGNLHNYEIFLYGFPPIPEVFLRGLSPGQSSTSAGNGADGSPP